MPQKQNLPTKTCIICARPFTWRKKWEKVWEEVKYCSDKCRKNKSKKHEGVTSVPITLNTIRK